jgi:phosphate transport system substrate-binding protein
MEKPSYGKYTRHVLLTVMLGIPFVITCFFLLIHSLFGSTRHGFTMQFVSLLLGFFGPLLIGGAAGWVFSATYRNKPDSMLRRYLPVLLPFLYVLGFAVYAALVSPSEYTSGAWGTFVWKSPSYLVINVLLLFSSSVFLIPVVELSAVGGFALGSVLQEMVSRFPAAKGASAARIAVLVSAAVALVLFTGKVNYGVLERGIVELRYGKVEIANDLTEYDLSRKAPFTGDHGLAKLDKEASLQFTELWEMPKLDGATAAYPVYASFVEAVYKGLGEYYRSHAEEDDRYNLFVESDEYPYSIIKCTKTQQAYENLINGQTDIIFVAEPSEAQVDRIKWKNDEFVLTPIGSEAFVFFTNVKNPVENLTVKQLQEIYSGQTVNWKEAGGEDASIIPFQRPEDSGSQTVMQNKVMKGMPMITPTSFSRPGGMGGMIQEVASYYNAKNAIGYSFMYYSSTMVGDHRIKYIGVDGVLPTTETVRNRTYPLTVPIYAVTLKSNTNPSVAKLLEWIVSEEGQSLVKKTGYVPIR